MTRWPIRQAGTPSPTSTMVPQTSAPWMRGKVSGVPDQPPSRSSAPAKPAAPPALDPSLTALEYQPVRVLMSVLLTPAAATRIIGVRGAEVRVLLHAPAKTDRQKNAVGMRSSSSRQMRTYSSISCA